VIRLESGKRPDFLRVLWLTKDSRFGPDGSPMFVLLNPDKDSLTLNLKHPEARALAERLVAWADVLCENYAPGVMEKLGLGAERVRALNPEIVMASGCLFGQTGPQRHYPGFGGQGSAISGFNHLTGWPDGPAHGPYATITDSLSPRYVAVAIAAALWRRRRGGGGATLDLSQIEAAVYSLSEVVVRFSANGEVATRRGNRDEWTAPHGVYPCRGEDRWIAIATRDEADWQRLVGALGHPEWAGDPRFADVASRLAHQDALDEALAGATRERERYALMHALQAAGVEAGVVQDFDDLLADPQLAHRGHWVPLTHVHLGTLQFDRSGFRLSAGSGALTRPGPNLGQHNREVLRDVLGLDDAEIERLVADEAVA
jgi:benzylsuccinate CoA-transferase BbsF subunit